jgi:tRNA threonylcarbamoyladenosine biosynthesis protein TsaB
VEGAAIERTWREYNIAPVNILAVETVTRRGSLALLTGDRSVARAGDDVRTHGERLPGDAIALLAEYGLTINDVDLFAVVQGPGSFTGLRIGMAAVQGFALPHDRHVVAVPTLDAMAEGWRLASSDDPHRRRESGATLVVACLDGQRGDVFFAAWALPPDVPVEQGRVVIEPAVGVPADAAEAIARLETDLPIVIVGDGDKYRSAWSGLTVRLDAVPMTLAEVAARVAACRPDRAGPPHALRPLYIRRPDAVLARERARLSRP